MDYNVDGFLSKQYDAVKPLLSAQIPLASLMDWKSWQANLRSEFKSTLGTFPTDFPPLDVTILSEKQLDGYTRTKINYTSEDGLITPAYILKPDNCTDSMPAVVALTGHGVGCCDIVGLTPYGEEQDIANAGYQKNFAVSICKKGLVVIAPELIGFGELRLAEQLKPSVGKGNSSCHQISANLLMLGRTMAGVRALQAMRAIDVLETLSYVNNSRIGCMGISGGGLVSSFLAALDTRIKACVVSGFANTFEGCIMAMFHCIDNYVPGLLKIAEMPDLLSLIAPRPMLWEAGTSDPIFPFQYVLKAYEFVGKVYEAQGARDKFDLDSFEGDHMISGAKSYDFLKDHL